MKKIVVVMMVKDEEALIERALSSVVGVADSVIISDTGSSDSTVARAALFLQHHKVPFKIHNTKFKDFAAGRNRLLTLANLEGNADYALMLDADEVLMTRGLPFDKNLEADYYNVAMNSGNLSYYLPRLTRVGANLEYVGVTHEYLDTKNSVYGGFFCLEILQVNDSCRQKSGNKFINDIELLTRELARTDIKDTLRARYMFYLAQSHFGAGNHFQAIECYEERAKMGGWSQEVYYSYYQIGKILVKLESHPMKVMDAFLAAQRIDPNRTEHIIALRDFVRDANILERLNNTIETMRPNKPANALFIEEDKYGPEV